MNKIMVRGATVLVIVVAVAAVMIMRRRGEPVGIDKARVEQYASELGKGHDAEVLAQIVAHNAKAAHYIFALEVHDDEVIRHTTPNHVGEHVTFATHPHIHELVMFAETQGEGILTYDATNTPDACGQKTAYLKMVQGDDNKMYVVGQGYCQ